MAASRHLFLVALMACATAAWAGPARRVPRIGYLFPAGAKQGTSVELVIGGQFLNRPGDVYVTGGGVRVSVIKYYRPRRNLNGEQRKELVRQLRELAEKQVAALPAKNRAMWLPGIGRLGKRLAKRRGKGPGSKKAKATPAKPAPLPNHPMVRDLQSKSLRELLHVASTFLDFRTIRKKQRNVQLGELVLIKATIDPQAEPGDRELRIRTALGLSNPMCFQVGTLPEVREQEPNDPKTFAFLPKEPPVDLPVVVNGQILPGDVDRFRFRAKRGQRVVIETRARHLVPFLADAVPGWFQATVVLYDSKGREVAFADDYQFRPDPVLFCRIPADGLYELEIRDALYRGREDFVYRVAVGELPFIKTAFPLGGQAGVKTVAAIDGWNLLTKELPLDTEPGDDGIRQTALRDDNNLSNEVTYAVDTLPECTETEPNDDAKRSGWVTLPRIVNGRIDRAGDVDVFQFAGRAGQEVVAEVLARRLYSPMDSLVRVTDSSGRVLAWNDDCVHKDGTLHTDMGVLTHHADSYLRVRLPKDGRYNVHVADTQHHGGKAYAYRLRLTHPRPDFALQVTPSSLSMPAGRVVPITMHVLRKDGFEGDVEVALKDAPIGFTLSGGRIPRGRDSVRMTLTGPRKPSGRPAALKLVGRARIDGVTVRRPAVPSDDVMQAFLWRHLAPSQALMVAVTRTRWTPPPVTLARRGPVRIPAGGTAQVRVKTGRGRSLRQVQLALNAPPKGVAIQNVKAVPDGLAFQLKADGESAKAGLADNLIVEAFTHSVVKPRGKGRGQAAGRKRRVSLGMLPAIAFVVVQPMPGAHPR